MKRPATFSLEACTERLPGWPDKCPITGEPFFMWLEQEETGEPVPTYGGPFDSYTLPIRDEEGRYTRERYDHDQGLWVGSEMLDQVVVSESALSLERENKELREALYDMLKQYNTSSPTITHATIGRYWSLAKPGGER